MLMWWFVLLPGILLFVCHNCINQRICFVFVFIFYDAVRMLQFDWSAVILISSALWLVVDDTWLVVLAVCSACTGLHRHQLWGLRERVYPMWNPPNMQSFVIYTVKIRSTDNILSKTFSWLVSCTPSEWALRGMSAIISDAVMTLLNWFIIIHTQYTFTMAMACLWTA